MATSLPVKYVTLQGARYRYQRRVPEYAQAALGRTKWNLSLGRDRAEAALRANRLRDEHDEWLRMLSDPETARQAVQDRANIKLIATTERAQQRFTELEEAEAPSGDEDVTADLWQRLPIIMRSARDMEPAGERLHLETWRAVVEELSPAPDDEIDSQMRASYLDMIDKRLHALGAIAPANPKHKLSYLTSDYARLHGGSEATTRTRWTKVRRLIEHLGDLPVTHYTPEMLREHRDYLLEEGLSPVSVGAYLDATRTVFRWAMKEGVVPGFEANPLDRVTKPRADKTVEERRWRRFDESEIRTVWKAVQDGWGPNGDSRFSIKRRRAFLMVFRVLLHTGLRPFEVFALADHGKVTPTTIHVVRTKTRTARDLPLPSQIADFHDFWRDGGFADCDKKGIAGRMSESFTGIIRAAGLTDSRHVLYSTKDTIVDRLQRLPGSSDDLIRAFTGHVSGQGHLRSYKTRLNDTPEGLEIMRRAIEQVRYW